MKLFNSQFVEKHSIKIFLIFFLIIFLSINSSVLAAVTEKQKPHSSFVANIGNSLQTFSNNLSFGLDSFVSGYVKNTQKFFSSLANPNQKARSHSRLTVASRKSLLASSANYNGGPAITSTAGSARDVMQIANKVSTSTQISEQVIKAGLTGSVGPQGLPGKTGRQGPKGDKGEPGDSINTLNFVTKSFFDKQINGLLLSIERSNENLSNSINVSTSDNTMNSLYSGLATSKQDALSGTGFIKISGTTISYDNSTYVTGTPWTAMGYLTSFTETDPTISAWAKAGVKPTYTATEVGLGNVPNLSFSGSNTGDETLATIKTKLGITTLSGSNTGDNSPNSLYSGLISSQWLDGGSGKLFYNSGNVGIGTATPGYNLDVNGQVNATGYLVNGVPLATGGNTQWGNNGAKIYYNTGNVGFGTTDPRAIIGINQTNSAASQILLSNNADNVGDSQAITFQYSQSNDLHRADIKQIVSTSQNYGSVLGFFTQGNLASGSIERMRIDNNGNVGIGTISPSSPLTVQKTSTGNQIVMQHTDGTLRGGLSTTSSGAGQFFLNNSSGSLTSMISAAGDSYFNGGNVGIGTTTPKTKLDVNGRINLSGWGFDPTSGAGLNVGYVGGEGYLLAFDYDAPARTPIRFDASLFHFDTGNVGIGTSSPSNLLDVNGISMFRNYQNIYYGNSIQSGKIGSAFDFIDIGEKDDIGIQANKSILFATNNTITTKMILDTSGNLGVGTTAPSYKLEVSGVSATDGIRTTGGLDFNQVVIPNLSSVSLVSSPGNVDAGTHYYAVTYITAMGETSLGENYTPITTDASHGQVTVTIPVSSDPRVIGRKIYRTKAGSNWWDNYYLTTVANNTATSYIDNTADSSLATFLGENRLNTTNKLLTINGNKALTIDGVGTYVGLNAGSNITTGAYDIFMGDGAGGLATTASDSVCIGSYSCGAGILTGNANVFMGNATGALTTSGFSNTGIGYYSLINITTGYQNVALGDSSGRYLADGSTSNTTSNTSIYLGHYTRALTNGDANEIVIGDVAIGNGSNSVTLGNDSITKTILKGNVGIGIIDPLTKLHVGGTIRQTGCTTAGGLSTNALGDIICTPSSIKFKENKINLTNGLSTLLQLNPVSYTFKTEMNMGGDVHYGFISEEVNDINKALATHDANDKPYGLDTSAILAVTVNAVKEMNLKVEDLSNIDTASATSLGSLIKNFLSDQVVLIKDVTTGTLHIGGNVCVDDICITKDQFKQMLLKASESTSSSSLSSGENISSGNDANTSGSTNGGTTGADSNTDTASNNGIGAAAIGDSKLLNNGSIGPTVGDIGTGETGTGGAGSGITGSSGGENTGDSGQIGA